MSVFEENEKHRLLQTREKTEVRVNMNEANSLHQNGKEPTIFD